MAPTRRTTRASPATITTTTPVTNTQLKALIEQSVANALAALTLTEAEMAMTTIIQERVVEGQNELLVSVLTLTFSNVNPRTSRELDLMCGRMFLKESDKTEKYVGGLPDMIHGSVMSSKPKTMHDVVEFATKLMDKKSALLLNVKLRIKGSKMITNNNKTRDRTLAGLILLGMGRRSHMGDLSHYTLNATTIIMVHVLSNATRNYRSDFPELKNQNHDNQAGGTGARGMVHALGGGKTNQDLNKIKDDINA
nr:reverse transcriptase domain-containing protein [Tanacetum cinerariifolium]